VCPLDASCSCCLGKDWSAICLSCVVAREGVVGAVRIVDIRLIV
jgi:hypothetical protein